jgi:hypothetical protein
MEAAVRPFILTLTRDRPFQFKLCAGYVARQSARGRVEWMVVDDGAEAADASRLGADEVVVRPPSDLRQTLPENMLAGLDRLEKLGADAVVIMEDDDWYAAGYVEFMLDRLQEYDLAGLDGGRYYNFRTRRYMSMPLHIRAGDHWCSLCRTAFTQKAFDPLREICGQATKTRAFGIDILLWQADLSKKGFDSHDELCVSMKGGPGRAHAGSGGERYPLHDLSDGGVLKSWIGEPDAIPYLTFDFDKTA